MGLIGHWRRSVLGAGGVALLLPLGLTLGVLLTTALGGGTTLRALGQVFAGPTTPARGDSPGLEAPRSVPSVPVRKRRSAAATGAGGPAPTSPGPSAPSGGTDPAPAGNPTEPQQPAAPAPTGPPAGQDPGPDPAPAPASPVHDAAQDAADVVAQVPVAGAATGDAMQTVIDLLP